VAKKYKHEVKLAYYLTPGDESSVIAETVSRKVLVTPLRFVIRPEWVEEPECWSSRKVHFKKEYRFDRDTGVPVDTDAGKWRLAKGELQKLNLRFGESDSAAVAEGSYHEPQPKYQGDPAFKKPPVPGRVKVRVREETPQRVKIEDRPEPLTLQPGEMVVVEFNENVSLVQPLKGGRVRVSYNPASKIPVAKYYAHLRPDGVLEIIPGCVLRPKE
jgi:hypothetical protein